ncbi:heavy metal-binding domain-containing protein [soil metagenome]
MARPRRPIMLTTTALIEGRPIEAYLGLVAGEAVVGANVARDLVANLRDLVGGRSTSYERLLSRARDTALDQLEEEASDLGADAVIGLDIDYQSVGPNGHLMMVSVAGTAVRLKREALTVVQGTKLGAAH